MPDLEKLVGQEIRTLRDHIPEIETRITQYEMAYRMQRSVPELMDLGGEPAHLRSDALLRIEPSLRIRDGLTADAGVDATLEIHPLEQLEGHERGPLVLAQLVVTRRLDRGQQVAHPRPHQQAVGRDVDVPAPGR